MSAYQKLKEFQDMVEQMTGVRPFVHIKFHSHYGDYDDETAAKIRNVLVVDSGFQLAPADVQLGDKDAWTVYQAFDLDNQIDLSSHGPHIKVEKEEKACGA